MPAKFHYHSVQLNPDFRFRRLCSRLRGSQPKPVTEIQPLYRIRSSFQISYKTSQRLHSQPATYTALYRVRIDFVSRFSRFSRPLIRSSGDRSAVSAMI